MFALSFLVMIWGVLSWEDLGVTIWPTMGWWFPELTAVFLVASVIVAIIDRIPVNSFMDTFHQGCNRSAGVAIIYQVARGVS